MNSVKPGIEKEFDERAVNSVREVFHSACFVCYLIKMVRLCRSMDNLVTHCADNSYVFALISRI